VSCDGRSDRKAISSSALSIMLSRLVNCNEEDAHGRASVTTDEQRVLHAHYVD